LVLLAHKASRAHLVSQEPPVLKELRVLRVLQALRVLRVLQEPRVLRVFKVRLVSRAPQGPQDHKEQLAPKGFRVPLVLQVLLGLQVRRVPLDRKEQPVPKGQPGFKEPQGQPAQLVLKAKPDLRDKALKALREPLVLQDLKEHRELLLMNTNVSGI
jgi:hypothetical protein